MAAGVQIIEADEMYFIGESHALRFGNRVIVRDDGPSVVCRSVFLADAANLAALTDEEANFHPTLRGPLTSARLLVDALSFGEDADDEAAFRRAMKIRRRASARPDARAPMLVFCLGSYDVFVSIMQFPHVDFAIPPTPYLHRLPAHFSRALPGAASADEATAWFIGRVKPFQHMLARLRALGFTRVACLSIVPPTLDDRECHEVCRMLGEPNPSRERTRAAFRYKCAVVLNALLRLACEAEGAAFLDAWPMLTEGGVVAPGILSDRAHLAPSAVDEILATLVAPAATAIEARVAVGT